LFEPFITSIGYDRRLMGKRAVEILMEYRQGDNAPAKEEKQYIREVLPVHFVEGATMAPPRKTI
jgi:DNA-binding LacI/PurR family transcriptional regulator